VNKSALRARGLCKRLGRQNVLDGVDLELRRGEIAVLLGANGAGKTTLLRVLAGLSLPSRGSVEIAGSRDRRQARAAVGYVGHETMLYGALSAAENLRFAARLYGHGPERVRGLLEAAELVGVADQRAESFSRGMRQRLAIARAQVHEPSVLLLDEPFNALDPRAAAALDQTLRHLRDTGAALCLVSHDLERAAKLADVVWVLRRGRVESVATAPVDPEVIGHALEARS
jgi:heme ABC exporter ATP-binding subunit CcmA